MEGREAGPGRRRLVLGFDAGCTTCSDLARKIEEAAGGRLEIRSLDDPTMARWRREALGENAPWAPTLVELEGVTVRGWTGTRMGARLALRLGPAATWRVVRILGGAKKDRSLGGLSYEGLNRSQFLKGVGGAIVGVAVLSGRQSPATAATAHEHWLARLSFSSSAEISRKEATVAWARQARGRHLRGFLRSPAVGENPAAGRLRSELLAAARPGDGTIPTATIRGVRHRIEGGGQLLALSYQNDEAAIISYRLDEPGQKTRQFSRVIEDESEETVGVSAEAEDGDVFSAARDEPGVGPAARSGCRRCAPCYGCRCVSINKRCAALCCGSCMAPCAGWNVWACITCVAIWCPVCTSLARCCYRKGCRYISGC